ncbi:MAG: hypothetical protein QHH10_04660 [Peptococcaceae bacterium]|jgi:uncharacterized membrane protein|nr:putative ABC transporter permease [Peptococcaceae bacterium]MDH7524589.1 hypothetical protein [Peptococcaceae bacterium]
MVTRFLIYGILGWAMEVMWTGLGALMLGNLLLPGFTYLWMFPIYGAAVFLEPLHDRIRMYPWYIRGIFWAGVIICFEYLTGWLLYSLLGSCPWDYSRSTPYHVNGLIRLDYLPVWFVVGLLFEKIHLFIDRINV